MAAFGDIVVAGFMDCPNYSIRNGCNGWSFSTDGARTWTDLGTSLPLDNPSDLGTGGDPSLDVDSAGNFYFASLYSRVGRTALDVSVHKGRFDPNAGKIVWGAPAFATDFTTGRGADKELIAVDPRTSGDTAILYVAYMNFSIVPTQLEVVRSTDGGRSWSTPVVLASGFVQGPIPRIGPDGEIYVAWWKTRAPEAIKIRKSVNWPDFGPEIHVSNVIPTANPCFNDRINEFPTMGIDRNNGANRGRVYIAWNDGRLGNVGQCDQTANVGIGSILLAHSADGMNWIPPIRVNDDPFPQAADTDHFFPWMSVDPNGVAHLAWYDRRLRFVNCNINCDDRTDVFAASFTVAGGVSQNVRITDQTFSMNVFCDWRPCWGDYIGSYATATKFHVAWADGRNGDADVFSGGRIFQ